MPSLPPEMQMPIGELLNRRELSAHTRSRARRQLSQMDRLPREFIDYFSTKYSICFNL